jgi:hypothetical protein
VCEACSFTSPSCEVVVGVNRGARESISSSGGVGRVGSMSCGVGGLGSGGGAGIRFSRAYRFGGVECA